MPATFTKQSGDALWSLDGAPATCTVAFAPFDPSGVPASGVALADTWSTYPGTYVVLPRGTALTSTLAASLGTYLGWQVSPVRFAWVPRPTDDPHRWDASTIAFAGTTTTGLSGIGLGSYALWVGGGCAGAPGTGADADSIVLTSPQGSVAFTSGFGVYTFPGTAAAVKVPFAGATAGCVTSGITLAEAGGAFEQLDVGLRFFAPAPGDQLLQGRLASYRYPLFSTTQPSGGASVPATVSLDPAAPFDPTRTFLGLVPDGAAQGPQLASYYRTANRLSIRLTPLATPPARLVPAVRALSDPPSPVDPLYLIPYGGFAVEVLNADGSPATGTQQLMCGTSGIEHIDVPASGSELWFTPGGAALAGSQGLTSVTTTAYTSAFNAGGTAGLVYRAQPDASALFASSDTPSFLAFNPLPGVTLPAAPGDGALPAGFPMAPFAGIVDANLVPYQDIEQKALAPTRRKTIGATKSESASDDAAAARELDDGSTPTPTVTPQGLLAGVDGGGIAQLTLLVSGAGPVQIGAVTPTLASALQANQLFLVASNPAPLLASGEVAGTVTIPPEGPDQWTIDVWPETWSEMGTLLVMKFAGKSLRDLAADTSTWADAATFNPDGVDAAKATLLATIDEAIDRARTDPEFLPFAELAVDARWQGLLILNAPIPPADLPKQLAGLAAGINSDQFKAHHLGLTVTPVDASGGAPAQKLSSLFGLIFYESTTTAAGAKGPYAFNVLTLKVRFENSAVATFSSRIQLLVDQLFGEPAARTDASSKKPCADNVLLLYGVYQQQGKKSGYTFSTDQDNVFVMTSGVLSTVEVATAQFVTVVAPADSKPPAKPAESAFVLTGAMRFLPPADAKGFDLFSFGPDVKDPLPLSPQRLTYSNLIVELAYDPNDKTHKTDVYTFDATKLVMDASQSPGRDSGVFNDFPLTLSSFVHVQPAAAGTSTTPATPSSLGFAGVDVPSLPQGSIAAPWFGIVADLGLGTAGALAAQAGFKASLLAAWSPGQPSAPNVGVGLKLPGTGTGGKLLSLESVLKLKVGDISFVRTDNAYVLALQQIALSVLTLSFPPGGQIDALLFADPTGRDHTTLGWYAGYAKTGGK